MLCLVAIFKNESEIIDEWINHYINEGVDHFFLIDNNSTDNYDQILKKYNNITLIKDDKIHAQTELYNKYFLEKVKSYEWTIVCDLDEFIYSRNQYKTISSFLSSVPNTISQIAVPWKLFSSNGFNTPDKKEPPSVIQGFTKRLNYDKTNGITQGIKETKNGYKMDFCKCIVRSSALKKLGIHHNQLNNGLSSQSTIHHTFCDKDVPFIAINEDILKNSYLQLNHYAIRSLDWFTRIKMTRGSANSVDASKNKSRIGYFWAFEKASNDIDDFELCNKKYN